MSPAKDNLVIDSGVFPAFAKSDDIRAYMTEPYNIHFFPNASRYWYPRPFGEFAPAAELGEGRTPGSDPAVLARQVLDEKGVRAAILIPHGRGLFPDLDVMSAVCSATNQWLAETWL